MDDNDFTTPTTIGPADAICMGIISSICIAAMLAMLFGR